MKAFLTLGLIVLVALGVYNYLNDNSLSTHFTDDLPEHITIEGGISLRERAEQGNADGRMDLLGVSDRVSPEKEKL